MMIMMMMIIIIYSSACSPSHWNCVVTMENIFGIKADTSLQWKIRGRICSTSYVMKARTYYLVTYWRDWWQTLYAKKIHQWVAWNSSPPKLWFQSFFSSVHIHIHHFATVHLDLWYTWFINVTMKRIANWKNNKCISTVDSASSDKIEEFWWSNRKFKFPLFTVALELIHWNVLISPWFCLLFLVFLHDYYTDSESKSTFNYIVSFKK